MWRPSSAWRPARIEIGSSPAVDDLDGDGWPEVVVGVGSIYPSVCRAAA